jgi:hypothetical protein
MPLHRAAKPGHVVYSHGFNPFMSHSPPIGARGLSGVPLCCVLCEPQQLVFERRSRVRTRRDRMPRLEAAEAASAEEGSLMVQRAAP